MHCSNRSARFLTVFIMVIAVLAIGRAVLAGTLPSEIRVGISYGKDAWATANFSGTAGLALGGGRTQTPLWTNLPNQRLTLVGDGFRLEVGRTASREEADLLLSKLKSAQLGGVMFRQPDGSWAVRVGHSPSSEGLAVLRTTLVSKGFAQLKEIGGYRLELQESYTSRVDVDKRVSALSAQGLPAYPAYQMGWRVWIGECTEAELDGMRTSLGKVLPGMKTTLVNPDIDRVVAIDQGGNVALVYASQAPVAVADGLTSQRADNYRVEVGPYANLLAANQAQQQLTVMGYPLYRVKNAGGSTVSYSFWVGDGWEPKGAQETEKAIRAKGFPVLRIVGPYRWISFSSFATREAAQAKASQLKAKGLETSVLYDNAWRVAVGNAATAQERDALRTALTATAPLELYSAAEIDGGRMQIFDSSSNLLGLLQMPAERPEALKLWPLGDGAVYSDEKKDRYPGVFEVRRYYHGGLTVINRVGVEDYVAGVAAKEMYPSWPLEALKAQAVASRSYATMKVGNVALSQWGCDVDDTTSTQVYAGLERAGYPNIQQAVKETAGQYAWYNGQVANTYFHADGGGHTENSENVWSAVVPYIRGVPELFPSEGSNASWQRSMSAEEIRQAVIRNGLGDVGTVTDLIIDQMGVSGAPIRLRVVGTRGEELLLKDDPRSVFGFPSNNFAIIKPGTAVSYHARGASVSSIPLNPVQATVVGAGGKIPLNMVAQPKIRAGDTASDVVTSVSDEYVFNGRGYGHGLGMSQWGAKAMADHGYTHIQILQHYYQGIVVK